MLDAAVAQLPEAVAAGHCASGGAPAPRQVQLRVDAAGCSVHIAEACRQRNIKFFMTARSNDEVTTAIDHNRFDRDTWQPALSADGEPSERAQVRELTEFVDLEGWPERTRFIARRRAAAPPARSAPLFDSELWRYRGFYTDADGDPAELDAHMRAHARIENTIAALKDSGLKRMPFSDFDANAAWTQLVALSMALVRWFQQLRLRGPLAQAAPQTPQMATMARTRPARALLKKMDPAPARLVARHSATTARLQPRRPIDTRHRSPAPAAAKTLTPARPHTQTRATKQPQQDAQPQHAPPTQPNQQTRHPKSYDKTQ